MRDPQGGKRLLPSNGFESVVASAARETRSRRRNDPHTLIDSSTSPCGAVRCHGTTRINVIRTNSRRLALGTTALCLAGAAAVGATSLGTSATAAGAEIAPVAVQAPAALTPAQVRAETIRKYGVHPLPISERTIVKYKLSKKTLRDLVKARKLANTSKAKRIRKCESGGNYKSVGNGYYGAYQFDRGTWLSNGGGKFGRTANKAPAWAQDLIMYKTYKARGWSPWACQ